MFINKTTETKTQRRIPPIQLEQAQAYMQKRFAFMIFSFRSLVLFGCERVSSAAQITSACVRPAYSFYGISFIRFTIIFVCSD